MTMTKRLTGLWILLAIQILVAIWLWWPRQSGPATGQPWLAFSPQKVTRVTLAPGSKKKSKAVVIEKTHGKWQLPGADGFPADADKVKQLIHAVAGLKGNLPVAVTRDAAKRFRVAKNKYATRVTFGAGKHALAKFYVGNAAGANRVYLRPAGSRVIEAHELPSRLLGAALENWRDPDLLHVPQKDIKQLTLPGVTLVKQKTGWTAKGSKTPLATGKTTTLVAQLADLDYLKVLGKKAAHTAKPTFKISVAEGGKTLVYDFAKVSGKSHKGSKKQAQDTWQVTRSDLPYAFTVSADVADALSKASAQSLAKAPSKNKAAKQTAESTGKQSTKAS